MNPFSRKQVTVDVASVRTALLGVQDPELHLSLEDAGMLGEIDPST